MSKKSLKSKVSLDWQIIELNINCIFCIASLSKYVSRKVANSTGQNFVKSFVQLVAIKKTKARVYIHVKANICYTLTGNYLYGCVCPAFTPFFTIWSVY